MKVLFLDFDGVLNDTTRIHSDHRTLLWPEFADRINTVLETTGAKIVVSSDWRRGFTLKELRDLLSRTGVTGEVLDVTAQLTADPQDPWFAVRGREVLDWLANYPGDIDSWALVDDFAHEFISSIPEADRFRIVNTSLTEDGEVRGRTGIEDYHVRALIRALHR